MTGASIKRETNHGTGKRTQRNTSDGEYRYEGRQKQILEEGSGLDGNNKKEESGACVTGTLIAICFF